MRALLIPMLYAYQGNDIGTVSNVNAFLDLARGITRVEPRAFVHVALPFRTRGGWEYEDALYAGERIAPLFYRPLLTDEDSHLPRRYENSWVDVALANALNEGTKDDYWFDLVLNGRANTAHALKALAGRYGQVWRDVPHVTMVVDGTATSMEPEPVLRREVQAFATDWCQFTYPNEVRVLLPHLRRFLSAAELRRLLDPPFVVPFAVDFARCLALEAERGPRPERPPVPFFGGTVQEKKRVDVAVEVCKPLWILGRVGPYRLTTPTESGVALAKVLEAEHVALYPGPSPRPVFWERTFDGDFFHCLSTNESGGIAYFEMLMLGLVGVFQDAPWMEGVLPEAYPFRARTLHEVAEMTRWVAANLAEARRLVEPAKAEIRKTFDADRVARLWLGHARRLIALHRERNPRGGEKSAFLKDLYGTGLKALGWPDRVPLGDVQAAVREHTASHFDPVKMRWKFGRLAQLDALTALGYADACDGPVPVLVREAPGG
jgi:hypothetical protein